jgi:hypothetical protein
MFLESRKVVSSEKYLLFNLMNPDFNVLECHRCALGIDWLIMWVERGHISELRPPSGVLFILRVIYKHGETWWNDIDRKISSFIHHSYLAFLPVQSSGSKQDERANKINLALRNILYIFASDFYKPWSLTAWGLRLPLWRWHAANFISHKNPSPRPGLTCEHWIWWQAY